MIKLDNDRFSSMVNKRLKWVGRLDALKIETSTKNSNRDLFRLTFTEVEECDTGDKFRNHVHILVERKLFTRLKSKNLIGSKFSFTAVIYEYYKKACVHKENGLFYRELSIGLKELKNINLLNEKKIKNK